MPCSSHCSLFGPMLRHGLSYFLIIVMYFAYLDEFGHDGPFVSRNHVKHSTSPVFGLAGFVMPADNVRHFGSWVFQNKCRLFQWEIDRSQKPAWEWEKKGSRFYTVRNIKQYYHLRNFTIRFLKTIKSFGGFVFYFGRKKTKPPEIHDSTALYTSVLRESIKRINEFCKRGLCRARKLYTAYG